MLPRLRCSLVLALALVAVAGPASAQHALVLSGGGARGLAHAGAIRALHELGYDPPLVVGTSMGAIVGALYAAGHDPDSLWQLIAGGNWMEWFAAEPVLAGRSRIPVRPLLTIGISRGRLQEGFVPTTGVNLRLVQLLFEAGVRAGNDFDSLPRRFRAVATDLVDGAEVVLAGGSLAHAVRASMAVPGAFAPVPLQGRVLIDGGVANNLPVSVARRLESLPVIAIDVVRPGALIEEVSALAVGIRAIRLLIQNARPDSLADPDILVLPDLPGGETMFPPDATPMLEAGYRAAMRDVPRSDLREPPARRRSGDLPATIDSVAVTGAGRATEVLVRRMLEPVVGPYDGDAILDRVRALYGTGLLHAVWPRVEAADGEPVLLVVEVQPLPSAVVTGAARWDNDRGVAAWGSLRRRLDLVTPLELRGTLQADEVGESGTLEASVFSTALPPLVWSAGAYAGESRVRRFDGSAVVGEDAVRRLGGWVGGERRSAGRGWQLALLAHGERISGGDAAPGWSFGPALLLARAPVPDRVVGIEPLLSAEIRVGDVAYTAGRIAASVDRSLGGRWRVAVLTDIAATTAGAPLDVVPASNRAAAPWLITGELRDLSMGIAGIDAAWRIGGDVHARLRLRAVGHGRAPGDYLERDGWRAGAEVGAVMPTVIGLVEGGIAVGEQHAWRLNLGIGARF